MPNKPSAVLLMERKDKAKKKLSDLQDKIDGEKEIYETNLGYELTRALSGLEANQRHLTIAQDLYDKYYEKDASREKLLEVAEQKRDKDIRAAEQDIKAAKDAFELAKKKIYNKLDEEGKLYRDRLERAMSAVELSEKNIERLRGNVPKAITRAVYAGKKAERELAEVEKIKQMSKLQQEDMKRKPVIPVLPASRPMPDDDEFEAYMSKASGIDMRQLANDRAAAISADRKKIPYAAHKSEEIAPDEEVFMFEGKRVSKFEYEQFNRKAKAQPVEEPTETDLEEPESEIDDDQLSRDIEEAKQRQRHFLLQLPKKPIKMVSLIKTD